MHQNCPSRKPDEMNDESSDAAANNWGSAKFGMQAFNLCWNSLQGALHVEGSRLDLLIIVPATVDSNTVHRALCAPRYYSARPDLSMHGYRCPST
jgi:hypothetical protein